MKHTIRNCSLCAFLVAMTITSMHCLAQLPNAASPSKTGTSLLTKEGLANRKFRYQRPNQKAVLTIVLLPDGTVQGNDHPNESHWGFSSAGDLIFMRTADGNPTNVFDHHSEGDGSLRFSGYYFSNNKAKVSITEVK